MPVRSRSLLSSAAIQSRASFDRQQDAVQLGGEAAADQAARADLGRRLVHDGFGDQRGDFRDRF